MKKIAFIFSLILICPFIFIGCGQASESFTDYTMNLQYDDEAHTLSGNMMVDYVNSSENAFDQLYFHLYPNAFREEAECRPVSNANEDAAYPNGKSYGQIEINGVFSGTKELQFEIGGDDKNILKVTLPFSLYPDERVKINIVFVTKLAEINHRLGYGENAVNFGNFYPIACVYEEGVGFMTEPYSSNGDPFYSEVANYNVEISYPEKYTLASSGDAIRETTKDGQKISSIQGQKIRDFCFVLSDKFKTESGKVGNTTINYYYYDDETSGESLKVACEAVETFNEMFGQYPYKTLAVVQTNFIHGGMEYPNLVMISDTVRGSEYAYVIVHEIAHQWWYGVVGSDQYNHAWQDEGLTDYSAFLFFREHSEYNQNFDTLIDGATSSYKLYVDIMTKLNGKADTSMDRPLDQFPTEPEYVACTYTKGALLFDTLRESVGERKFFKALKDYFKYYSYKNARPADMIASFESSTGYKLEGFFSSWLDGEVVIL